MLCEYSLASATRAVRPGWRRKWRSATATSIRSSSGAESSASFQLAPATRTQATLRAAWWQARIACSFIDPDYHGEHFFVRHDLRSSQRSRAENEVHTIPDVKSRKPQRVKMRRTRGWRKPPDTVYVGRPTRFGNPFRAAEHGSEYAVRLFEEWIRRPANRALLAEARRTLKGKNLGCWCPLGAPCHADVLLRLVNGRRRARI